MRILFTSHPAYGHVNTMLPLARRMPSAAEVLAVLTAQQLSGCGG